MRLSSVLITSFRILLAILLIGVMVYSMFPAQSFVHEKFGAVIPERILSFILLIIYLIIYHFVLRLVLPSAYWQWVISRLTPRKDKNNL
jgi:hypothetical protein